MMGWLNDFTFNLLGTGLGFLGAQLISSKELKTNRVAQEQEKIKIQEDTKEACLKYLKDELAINHQLLQKMNVFATEGPIIQSLFEPLNSGSNHLRYSAWENILKQGVVPHLNDDEIMHFRSYDRNIRNCTFTIQIHSSNWRRIKEWKEWTDIQPSTIKLVNPQYVMSQAIKEIRESIINSINSTNSCLIILNRRLSSE
ncbi:hypothetical protein [Paenibacillus lignilyticus]|uniref:Uncharacterized protein n=1 Tax=Paenibacillus lignilyticus TaxID=1172615 RepID=A0ABS5CGN9_9BACL|nr:hypothetical protein [Paenibacillus lignilyticus]MBP3965027.1 hypothetical protein [Paenibacillus lignilyticus]